MTQKEAVRNVNAQFEAWGYTVYVRKTYYGSYYLSVNRRNAVTGKVANVARDEQATHQDALDTARAIIKRDRRSSLYITLVQARLVLEKAGAWLSVTPESVVFLSDRTGQHELNLKTRTPEEILAHADGFAAAAQHFRPRPLKLSGGFDQSRAGADGKEPLKF